MKNIGFIGAVAAMALASSSSASDPAFPRAPKPRRREALANLSKRHPDYGCTVAEHEQRKRERAAKSGAA